MRGGWSPKISPRCTETPDRSIRGCAGFPNVGITGDVSNRVADSASGRLVLRSAEPADVETLHRFVLELAEAEEFPGDVHAQASDLAAALFGPLAMAEAVVAAVDDGPVGFALFYPTYSTILGKQGIHLEDLYVSDEYRGHGIGKTLLRHLAVLAAERGCARLEWWVLRTNTRAVQLYRRLGARELDEIDVMRLEGPALMDLARD